MDQKILVNDLIVDGEKLLKRLAEEGIPIRVAGWVKEVNAGRWYLYIATPLVKEGRKVKPVYHRVNAIRREMPEELSLDLAGFKLVGPGEPITRKVLEAPREKSGWGRPSFGEGGIRIGDVDVEEAYLSRCKRHRCS